MIELAKVEQIDDIMAIIDDAKTYLKAQGIDQWQNGYPNMQSLLTDIENQRLYVLKEGDSVIAVFAMLDYEKTYEQIEGKWRHDDSYLAIHRVAVHNDYKGQGKIKMIFDYAKKQNPHLRIDTHKDNLSMQNALKKNGFVLCGIIYLEDGAPRLAYDYHD